MAYSEIELVVDMGEMENGHVSNVKFVEYLEMGRRDWYRYCIQIGVEGLMAHLSVDYKKESFHQDRLRVRTWLDRVGNTSLVLKQTIHNQHGQLVIEAEAVLIIISRETREKLRVPDQIRNLLDRRDANLSEWLQNLPVNV